MPSHRRPRGRCGACRSFRSRSQMPGAAQASITPGSLVDIAFACGGLERENIRCVVRIGEGQLAQRRTPASVPEHGDPVQRDGRSALISAGRPSTSAGAAGRSPNVEAVIHRAVAEDSSSPAAAMRAKSTCRRPVSGPLQRREDSSPAARAARHEQEARNRQGISIAAAPPAGGEPARIVEKERPVEVGHPAFEPEDLSADQPRGRWPGP